MQHSQAKHTLAVSVIIPTRNCLPWLPAAIASIGPSAEVEIIVFDDGSTDGTREWLAEEARCDPRLVILTGGGIGPSQARNQAIDVARAPLVAFLDADDRWYPEKLATQLALHRTWPEIGFSFTDYRHVTEAGEDRGGCFAYWRRFAARLGDRTAPFAIGGDALAQLYAENVVGTSTVMARTDLLRAIGGFCGKLPSSEDWDLWLRLAKRSQVMCVPGVMVDYLMHRPGNVSGKARARLAAMRIIARRHESAVRRIDRSAQRCMKARLLEAEAEIAQMEGMGWKAVVCRLDAMLRTPSRRAAREVAGALRRVVWPRRAPEAKAGALPRTPSKAETLKSLT